MRGSPLKLILASLALFGLQRPVAACDLALALAVDVSASISPTEYEIQMQGLASALLDPEISEALTANRAAILLMQWSGTGRQSISLGWVRVTSHADMIALSAEIQEIPRAWKVYSTAIGEALLFAGKAFEAVPDCTRRVIDVSGDGLSNEGLAVSHARDALVAQNITVNGLAIETSIRGLTLYFREEVAGGQGSFVQTAANYADYPRAIRQKLLTEVIKPAF